MQVMTGHIMYIHVCMYREVIEKKPYEFKIECLQQVRSLFPDDYCPLHAGFGNRNSVNII